MSKFTRKPTEQEKKDAEVHATAWGKAWDNLMNAAASPHTPRERVSNLGTLGTLAMAVSGGYRAIANGAEIEL